MHRYRHWACSSTGVFHGGFHFDKLQTSGRVAKNAEFGASVIIIQGLATGMLSSIILMLFVDFAIIGYLGS